MKSYKELLNERANNGTVLRQLSSEEAQGLKADFTGDLSGLGKGM